MELNGMELKVMMEGKRRMRNMRPCVGMEAKASSSSQEKEERMDLERDLA